MKNQIQADEEVWFFDESRFGTHSKVGHAWYPKGQRSSVPIKLGYKNFYLYTAVCPKTGEEISLILPKVNHTCMLLFLNYFAKQTKGRRIVLIMDGAGWHQKHLLEQIPHIRMILQPSYSPELNPVERFWQYIKHHTIRNQIYQTLDELENHLCQFLNSITPETIKKICHVDYV